MVYAEFGGQTECIMGNSKIENCTGKIPLDQNKYIKQRIQNAVKFPQLKLSQRWNFNVTCTCNFSSAIAAESAFSKLTNAQNLLGRIRTLSTWPHLLKSCSKCLSLTSSGLTLPTHSERHEPSLLLLSLNLKKSKQKLSYNLGRIKCPWNIHTCLHSSSASAESSKCIHM